MDKSSRKLSIKEKWILTGVAILGVCSAVIISNFIRQVFFNGM